MIRSKVLALVAVIVLQATVRKITANSLIQNNSLPILSERANGGNSRYLSAASTASLAAATVAASNAVPQGASASSNQNQDRNYLLQQHQQQHQQPQQQQQQSQLQSTQAGLSATNANNPLSSPVVAGNPQPQQQQQQLAQQASLGPNLFNVPAPQYSINQAQQQISTTTPVMSTTFAFNPVTGQFVPSELTTSSLTTSNNVNNGLFGSGQSYGPFFPNSQQQQQQLQQLPFINQPFGSQQISNTPYNRVPPSAQPQRFTNPQVPYYQIPSPQRHSNNNQFNRRAGTLPSSSSSLSSSRYGNGNGVYNPLQQQQLQPATIVEDDSGFFQQQAANSGGLVNGINEQPFGGLDSLFGNGYPNGAGTVGINHNHQHQQYNGEQASVLSQSSSSVAPVALPTPTTTLSTSYGGLLGGEYKSEQCVAADNRHGTCYQASECIRRGGTPMGKCGSGSSDYSGSSYVCCLFDVTCGQFAAERFVYFRNPNHPNTYDQSKMCRAKIGKLDKGTCQFRLDMIRFDVAKPTNGNCSTDMFVVSGQNENYVIPKICGLNDGQHYYVGVDESGVITLHMMMMGYYRRSFEILITQIPCRSDYAAPAHCLQYFMGTHGTIKSFNYDDDRTNYDLLQQQASQQQDTGISLTGNPTAPYGLNFGLNTNQQLQQRQQQLFANRYGNSQQNSYLSNQEQYGGYPNDLDYTMCIRKESGFCSITYQLSRSEQGLQPFAVGHSVFGSSSSLGGQNDSYNAQSGLGWHPVSTECRDDYLLVGGVRLCSGTSGNQYPLVGGGGFESSPASIQFAQNGSVLNSAGIGGASLTGGNHFAQQVQLQQQQLQSQLASTMQQLARLQQQQQASNVSYANNNSNNNSASINQQQGGNANNNNNANLEQQQAALIQQSLILQQQLNYLASQQSNNRFDGDFGESSLQSSIITDNTPGPFILRFVSNLARNARGFHIDYRQNPCK